MAAVSANMGYFEAVGVSAEVQLCSYEITRPVDQKGRPSGVTQGGKIFVTLVASDQDRGLVDWLRTEDQNESGQIEFKSPDGRTLKTLSFENGRCIGYSERFERMVGGTPETQGGSQPAMILTVTISAEKLSIDGKKLVDNNWSDKRMS